MTRPQLAAILKFPSWLGWCPALLAGRFTVVSTIGRGKPARCPVAGAGRPPQAAFW